MHRTARMNLSQLEAREVPAAGLFDDIRPGVWGSNPTMLGASGDALYFSANNIYQGTELWVTDGTKAGTHMVKDLNPGKPGSVLYGVPAGGGVFYFTQSNEGSRTQTDYKTDGTADGTVPIANGFGSITGAGGTFGTGWKGELYYYARTDTPGVWALSKTDGTTVTVLTNFNHQQLDTGFSGGQYLYLPPGPALYDGGTDRLQLSVRLKSGEVQVWQTDGTVAGTTIRQANLTATSPTTGKVNLVPGSPLGGQFVFHSDLASANGSLWVGDGTSANRQLVRTFAGATANIYYGVLPETTVVLGSKALFMVVPVGSSEAVTPDTGVWATDGTAAGTVKLNLPTFGTRYPVIRGVFDGKAVLSVPTADPNKWNFVLTDGSTITPVPTSAGMGNLNWEFRGTLPADAAYPKGFLLFQEPAGGKAYRSDGTAAGTTAVDTAGLPLSWSNSPPQFSWNRWSEAVDFATPDSKRGLFFKGNVYFPGRDPSILSNTQEWKYGTELWKWDFAPPTTAPTPAPTVTGTQVNDGSAQRSMVKTLTVKFDSAVNVAPGGVTIIDAAGKSVAFSQQLSTANGVTTLTITFPSGVGGSVADGRYTLKITAGAVTRQTGGTAMASDYTFGFTRLYGDVTGDGVYDRDVRMLVKSLLGQHEGDAGYRWDLDVNGDGVIDNTDELAAIRGWGKAV